MWLLMVGDTNNVFAAKWFQIAIAMRANVGLCKALGYILSIAHDSSRQSNQTSYWEI